MTEQSSPLIDRVLDRGLDLALLLGAAFTAAYHLALFTGLTVAPLIAVALALALVGAVAHHWLGRRDAAGRELPAPPPPWGALVAVITLSAVAAVVTALASGTVWIVGWAVAAAAVAVTTLLVIGPTRRAVGHTPKNRTQTPRGEWWSSLVVALMALAAGVLSLYLLRVDPDDAFYVNRAQYVAENGRIPLRDVLFSPGTLPPLPGAGSTPVQSIEVLQGAIAHLMGLSAGTVCYLLFAPALTSAAVWALWRLCRTWALRAPFLVWAVALTYLVFGGQQGANFGVFFLARIWQGKVFFVAAVIPLLFHYATVWVTTRSRQAALMLAVAGAAATGLTSSATFLVPIIALAALVALVVCRMPWWGLALAAAYPVATAVCVMLLAPVGDPGGRYFAMDTAQHFVLGVGAYGALGLLAVLLAPWLVRGLGARVVAASASMALVVALAPGFAALFSAITGAGAVAWRLVWVAPVVTMVGLLATLPLVLLDSRAGAGAPRRSLATALLVVWTAALALGTAVAGHPIVSKERSVSLEDRPTWKYPAAALSEARAIVALNPGPRPILAPFSTMRALALTSASVHAVNPNTSYLAILQEPAEDVRARALLTALMQPGDRPPTSEVVEALRTLEVGTVCLPSSNRAVRTAIQQDGWQVAGQAGRLTCYRPAS